MAVSFGHARTTDPVSVRTPTVDEQRKARSIHAPLSDDPKRSGDQPAAPAATLFQGMRDPQSLHEGKSFREPAFGRSSTAGDRLGQSWIDYAAVALQAPEAAPAWRETPNSSAAEGAIIGAVAGGVLGAAVGFVAGGPAGAVAGGLLGAAGGALVGGAIGALVGAAAGQPGHQRSADLQPVVFRTGPSDPAPTGRSWRTRFGPSNTIWGKLGVTFTSATPVVIDNATLKSAGSNRAERDSIRASHSDATKVCVFMTDNDLADAGGGGTVGGGAAGAKIAMSDRGASTTLLAHELGHVLGLGHPPAADANTIMEPTGSNATNNPTRNTIGNYNLITWPAKGAPTTIHPDP